MGWALSVMPRCALPPDKELPVPIGPLAVTIRNKEASPSSSKRVNSEEMAFLSVLCSTVRLRGTRVAHRPWSRIFQGVREIRRHFYPGLLQQMIPGSIILNRRQKERDKEWYRQDIHALVSRWRKAVEVDGNCEKIEFGDKRSDLNKCYFHDSWINIYCGKTWVITFGQPSYKCR
jgi:hypothetical protein